MDIQFSNISLEDKDQISEFVNRYEPYSDFNFTSLICWDTEETTQVSWVNNNLVISLPHYITGDPVYSVLGSSDMQETVTRLVDRFGKLELVPQSVVDQVVQKDNLNIVEDRDNFDYIYSLTNLCELQGADYKVQRNKINQFNRLYPGYNVRVSHIAKGADFSAHRRVFLEWALEREVSHSDVSMESRALEKFMKSAERLQLIAVEITFRGKLIGFSINEIVSGGSMSICHFQKALHAYKNVDSALTHHTSLALLEERCKYVNWEQDLGIAGLRQLKQSYKPTRYLKKYTISKK